MNNEGHQIGSHTWSHPYLSSLSDADVTSQMTMVESAVSSAIGKYPTYMRPPYFDCGSACLNVMNNLGYHVIHANVDPQDYAHTADIQTAYNSYAGAIQAGGSYIVLNHDVHQTTVESLVQNEIDNAKSKGLTCKLSLLLFKLWARLLMALCFSCDCWRVPWRPCRELVQKLSEQYFAMNNNA